MGFLLSKNLCSTVFSCMSEHVSTFVLVCVSVNCSWPVSSIDMLVEFKYQHGLAADCGVFYCLWCLYGISSYGSCHWLFFYSNPLSSVGLEFQIVSLLLPKVEKCVLESQCLFTTVCVGLIFISKTVTYLCGISVLSKDRREKFHICGFGLVWFGLMAFQPLLVI